jgi:hypothetical protein
MSNSTDRNNSLDLTGLNNYINQESTELIAKSVFSAMSTRLFKVQTGVKAPTAINLLDTQVTFGDGKECGLDPMSAQTVSQRIITPGFIKVFLKYCHKDFYNTFASHLTNVAAGRETLPFEEYFVTDVIRNIGKTLEIAIWQGDVNAYDENLNKFDGLLKIMFADVPEANKQTVGSGDTMLDRVWNVYNAIPEETLFDTVIYMNNANFRALVKELVDANMYHYERNIDESLDIILPGTMTHVKAVSGLTGQDVIVACNPNHVVYGVDLENDMETFHFWFSTDNDTFRLRVEFSAGVQIALPNEVILNGTYVAPASDSE